MCTVALPLSNMDVKFMIEKNISEYIYLHAYLATCVSIMDTYFHRLHIHAAYIIERVRKGECMTHM